MWLYKLQAILSYLGPMTPIASSPPHQLPQTSVWELLVPTQLRVVKYIGDALSLLCVGSRVPGNCIQINPAELFRIYFY